MSGHVQLAPRPQNRCTTALSSGATNTYSESAHPAGVGAPAILRIQVVRQPVRDVAGLVDRLHIKRPLALELPAAALSLAALSLPPLQRQPCMLPPPGVPPAAES